MNDISLMGYPNPNPMGNQQQSQLSQGPQMGQNNMLNALHMPPPGLINNNNNNNNNNTGSNSNNNGENPLVSNSRRLLDQLANGNSSNNNNNSNNPLLVSNGPDGAAAAVGGPGAGTAPVIPVNVNANNPLFHPHLEDPSLLNNTIWKLQLQLAAVSLQSLGQPNVYARQNAMKKYLANQQPQSQPPQMTEASLSLVDRTKQLLLGIAVDVSKDSKPKTNNENSNNNNNGNGNNNSSNNNNNNNMSMLTNSTPTQTPMTTTNNSAISTPTTPQTELHNIRDQMSGTPAALLQHKKLSQYNIDEDDETMKEKLAATEAQYNEQLWHAIDLSNLQIVSLNKNLFKYDFLTRLYLNGNGLTSLPKEIRYLNNLHVLDLSHNRLTSLPAELGACWRLKYLYFFDNRITNLPWELGNLFNLQFLGCEGNPLDKQLLKILLEKSVTGLIFYLRDNRPEVPLPIDRRFIEIDTDGEPKQEFDSLQIANESLEPDLDKRSFTILTYNTLCQHYATPKMYRYTPSWALSWDYRREKLKEQILGYKCDVICLQEVEAKTYEDFWLPLLEKNGYSGIFHAKTRAKTMQTKDSKKVDGCCLFYKKSKFKLIAKQTLDFSSAWQKHKKFQRTEDYLNRAMNKDNVAIYLKLQHINTGEIVWAVTTHLHWDPKFNDVKTFQVGVLLDHMESLFREENPKQDIKKAPIFICGDLNSYKDSAVYELLSTGSVKDHPDGNARDFGYMSQKNFSHHLSLESSYNCIGELPFTNFTPSFTQAIDYIWYSTHAFRVRGLLGKIDDDYIRKFIGFPNDKFPSDHIPLISRLEFTKGSSTSRKV